MSVKRIYLCNLIPLWEADDPRLGAGWSAEQVRHGDIVGLRVTMRDLPLQPPPEDLAVRFEIKEDDFLLSGGADDRVARFGTEAAGEEGYEQRPLAILAEGEEPPPAERLRRVFVGPGRDSRGDPVALLQAFWRAEHQDDVAGEPEYYFDVELDAQGETLRERCDGELTVLPHHARFGEGFGFAAEADIARTLLAPVEPTVVEVGWSLGRALPGDTVDMIAVVRGGRVGQRVTFEVVPDNDVLGSALHRVDLPLGDGPVVRAALTLPDPLPEAETNRLRLRVRMLDPVPRLSRDAIAPELPRDLLWGSLTIASRLRMQVVDATGRPLPGVAYTILNDEDETVQSGTTDGGGWVEGGELDAAHYRVRLESVAVLDVDAPVPPPPPLPLSRVVFSFTDVRLPSTE